MVAPPACKPMLAPASDGEDSPPSPPSDTGLSSPLAAAPVAPLPPQLPGPKSLSGRSGRRFPNLTVVAKPSASKQLEAPSLSLEDGYESSPDRASAMHLRGRWSRRPKALNLGTPSSRSPMPHFDLAWTPRSPDPLRHDFNLITGDVGAIMFDFDGTLTASPGELAQRARKQVELLERTPLLAPRLAALQQAGITLGIISKSSELTISTALRETGLDRYFEGPLLAKAVGLEGKAGFLADLVRSGGHLQCRGIEALHQVVLVDDDVRELDRARAKGIQTYPAPQEGGLQEEDFDSIFYSLGLQTQLSEVREEGDELR